MTVAAACVVIWVVWIAMVAIGFACGLEFE
jgi:hypothetical protein